jgi:hypothetical protein
MNRNASIQGKTLYESLLREDFNRLPLSLQQFHRRPQGAAAEGTLTVRQSQGFTYRIFRFILRLPPPGEDVPAQLRVTVLGETEVWVRNIGGYRIETVQWRERDSLVEKIGIFRMTFRLSGGKEGMEFHFQKLRMGPLPIPPVFRVEASVEGDASCWRPRVRVLSPLFGLLFSYEGKMTPHP